MTVSEPRQTILLVEDNDDHAELVQRAFDGISERVRIVRLADGEEALNYFFTSDGLPALAPSELPVMMLLDLRLPKVDGLEVLRRLKETEALSRLPVVILTTSEAETDVARAYTHHANAYLVKPLEFTEFNDLLRDVGLFWLVWNKNVESS